MTDAERWQQIDQLFEAALERLPAERAAFLAQACGTDDHLYREVSSLLAAAEKSEDFIEASPIPSLLTGHGKLIGQTLGHYQLDALLGVGGMGEVYRAHDIRLGRGVAVKVLPPHLVRNHEAIRRFEREARAVAALSHPNILAIHDFGAEHEISYAVMELLEGETLQQRLQRGCLPWPEAVQIARSIAEGLAAAHAKGIIHRDIKAANIFLTETGGVKILDFGIARVKAVLLQSEQSTGLPAVAGETTKRGTLLGTPSYMSPEQVRGEPADAPSDVFSLGCLLFEMLTGQAPFTRATHAETLAAILRDDPPALRQSPLLQANPKPPNALGQLVNRCLAKQPAERYQSAAVLADELKRLSADAVNTRQPTTPRWLAPLVAVLLLALLGYGVWRWQHPPAPPQRETLAVLPLANETQDAELEYLCDGITESLTHKLAALPQLRVLAWSAAARFKTQSFEPRTVGLQLNARKLLLGKLTRHDNQLLLSVELVEAADGTHLWGATYQCPLNEAETLHTLVAQQLSAHLRLTPTGPQQLTLAKRQTTNAAAYQLYLKGRYFWNQRGGDSYARAIPFFEQAIQADPNFALAYAGLADVYVLRDDAQMSFRVAKEKAITLTQQALRLDNTLAEAHATLAFAAFMYDWNWRQAETGFQQALALNPNYATAHHWYAEYLVTQGRFDEALTEIKLAQELDPLSPAISKDIGVYLYFAHRFDAAIAQLQQTAQLHPDFADLPDVHSWLANAYEQQGAYAQTLQEYLLYKNLIHSPEAEIKLLQQGFQENGITGLRRAKLAILQQKLQRGASVRAVSVAHPHAMLGEADAAMEWLKKAYGEHHYGLTYLKVDPRFDKLHGDARFQDLLRRIGFAALAQ